MSACFRAIVGGGVDRELPGLGPEFELVPLAVALVALGALGADIDREGSASGRALSTDGSMDAGSFRSHLYIGNGERPCRGRERRSPDYLTFPQEVQPKLPPFEDLNDLRKLRECQEPSIDHEGDLMLLARVRNTSPKRVVKRSE